MVDDGSFRRYGNSSQSDDDDEDDDPLFREYLM
jgi:hypothetical protein